VFLLNRLDGMTYPAIAKALGVSVSTVEKDMIRALDLCRRWSAAHRGA
jgi:RNA polymerase sigma-70 factor (ECF subfamily)